MKGVVASRSEIKTWINPEGQTKKFIEVVVNGRQYACWTPEKVPAVGQEVEFEEAEKNGKYRMTISGGKGGGSFKSQSKDESFAASYSKDIAVALINHGKISTSQEIDATLLHYNNFFMNLLTKKSA